MKLPAILKASRKPKSSKDLYGILGVSASASSEEIKNSFKTLAKKLHPDLGGSEEDFTQLLNAYRILRDPKKRKLYDETGEVEEDLTINDFAVMMEGLVILFNSALATDLPDKPDVDLIAVMQKALERDIDSSSEEELGMRREIKKLKELKKRILRKSKGQNLFSDIMQKRISKLTKAATNTATRKRILLLAREELENYACVTEIADIVRYYTFTATDASTTTTWR